jgi:hypothetical protein
MGAEPKAPANHSTAMFVSRNGKVAAFFINPGLKNFFTVSPRLENRRAERADQAFTFAIDASIGHEKRGRRGIC